MTDLERLELILRRTRPQFKDGCDVAMLLDTLIQHLTDANETAFQQTRNKVFSNDKSDS